ncbi:MAG: DNA polymerase III subunit beta [Bdellovibrionales bacterium]|nr:DNA polymerase III subunit beta [Bdellovibrionales bacterium]
MNITVEREHFWPLISQIQGLLEKRTNTPIFENVLIKTEGEHITLYASDSELSFSGHFPGKVNTPGSLVVNGKRLFEIIRELSSGAMTLSNESHRKIQITKGDSKFQIHSLKDEDFPVFPPVQTKDFQKFKAKELLESIDKTVYCTSLDDSRYHLMGVFLESFPKESKYRWVATDGYRLSCMDTPMKQKLEFTDQQIIIPKKGLQEIKKMLSSAEENDEVDIAIEVPRLIVHFKNQKLGIRLIEGAYPDYKRLIPDDPGKEISLDREEFLAGLRRVSVLASARFKGVTFSFTKSKLTMEFINTDTQEEAREIINCESQTSKLKIRLNSKYVLDVLHSMKKKRVKMFFKASSSPCLFKEEESEEENKNYICIVMPMRF